MNKKILVVLGVFIAGFLSSRMMTSHAPVEKSTQCENLSEAKNDLISISQNEYLEYTQIKDLKQKYEKADELLGKVMLLFLADIGFKISKMSIDAESKNLEAESVAPKAETAKMEELAPTIAPPAVTLSQPSDPMNEGLKGKSELIRSLKSQAQINEALDKALIENPKVAVASGNPVQQQQMKIIEGSFAGEIKFLDKKREARNVSWELIPNYREKPIHTEFRLRMYGGGKGENVATSNGELRHVSILSEDPYAYMVETCGGSCYLQIYYNGVHDQFFGNYYESKENSKKFERVGLINLRR